MMPPPRTPPQPEARIDVIVPVRGAGAVFQRCASSLARHVDPARHRIVIVLDGPPDAETAQAVEALTRARVDLAVLEHPEPKGFVASVNRGLGLSDRDVVLLNSDTQVTARWLEKLTDAAYADPATATVTPFSNNATICSLPTFLAENTIPAGYDLDAFAALVERVAAREYPRIPTGVGACLFVKRRVLTDVGAFSDAFGPGYGEETDFCLRASARGYHHVLDDATFIFHEGSRSFGTSRQRRVRRAHRLIRSRHPGYQRLVGEFIRRDPIAPARGRVLAALRPPRAPRAPQATTSGASGASRAPGDAERVLHVVHGWPPWTHGGTELYAHWLAHQQTRQQMRQAGRQQARQRDVAVYARFTDPDRALGDAVEHQDHDLRVRLIVNNFTQRNPLCRNGFHCARIVRDFRAYLDEIRPTMLHVHHLAGHCASLLSVAKRRGIPIVYQAQDWWPICARVNLIDRGGALCSGPEPRKCARCLPLTNLPPAGVASAWLHRARRSWIRAQLAHVDAVVMGSEFIAESYRRWQVLPPKTMVRVVPYGVPVDEARGVNVGVDMAVDVDRATTRGRPLRFGYIGALLPHKGVHVCVRAFRDLDGRQAELHVWGSSDDRAYAASLASSAGDAGHIHFHGAFPESGKTAILRSLDALIVPSIGLESFGLVAREAWAQGVPILASRRGALTELFAEDQGGASFTPDSPPDLARQIQRVADEPALLDAWRRAAPPVKSVERHTEEIDEIYQAVARPQRR
jgi:glycosyltransferase involved in cell wall biosynthesis